MPRKELRSTSGANEWRLSAPIDNGEPITVGETDLTKAGFDSDAANRVLSKVGDRPDGLPHDVAALKSMLVFLRSQYELYRSVDKSPKLAKTFAKANSSVEKLRRIKGALSQDWLKDVLNTVERHRQWETSSIRTVSAESEKESLKSLERWSQATDEITAHIEFALETLGSVPKNVDEWLREAYFLNDDYGVNLFGGKTRWDNAYVAVPLYEAIYHYFGSIAFSHEGQEGSSVSKAVRLAKAVLDELSASKPMTKRHGRHVPPQPYTHDNIIAIWRYRRGRKGPVTDAPDLFDDLYPNGV